MSSEFEEAVIAFAQSLDAVDATDAERRARDRRLMELIDAEFEGTCFGIALKRLVHGCESDWAI